MKKIKSYLASGTTRPGAGGTSHGEEDSPRSLHPLTLADLREIRASMAVEGIHLTEMQFNTLIAEVEDDFTGGSAEAVIEQAKHWLAAQNQPLATEAVVASRGKKPWRKESRPAVLK